MGQWNKNGIMFENEVMGQWNKNGIMFENGIW